MQSENAKPENDDPPPHPLSDLDLRYHPAMPNWVKIVGLKIRAVPECEGGGFAIDRQQAEVIMDLRTHVLRLEGHIMEKNRTIIAARKALGGNDVG